MPCHRPSVFPRKVYVKNALIRSKSVVRYRSKKSVVKTCHVIDRTLPRKVYANDSTRVSSLKSGASAMIRSKVSYIWNNLLLGVWVIVRKRTCFLSWMVSFCCGILGQNSHVFPNRITSCNCPCLCSDNFHVIHRTFPRKVYANDSTRVSSFKSDACAMIHSKVSYI